MKIYLQPEMYNSYLGDLGFTLLDYQVDPFGLTLTSRDLKFSSPWPNKTLSVLQVKSSRKALFGFILDFSDVYEDLIKFGEFTTSMRCIVGKQTNGEGEVSGRVVTVTVTYKLPENLTQGSILVDRERPVRRELAGFADFNRECEDELIKNKSVIFADDGFVESVRFECQMHTKNSFEEAFKFVYQGRHPNEDHSFLLPELNPIHLDMHLEEDLPHIAKFMVANNTLLRRYDDGTADLHVDDGVLSKTISPRLPVSALEDWAMSAFQ
jgi:hypothetical protein